VRRVLRLRRIQFDLDGLLFLVDIELTAEGLVLVGTWIKTLPCGMEGNFAIPSWLVFISHCVRFFRPNFLMDRPRTNRTITAARWTGSSL